MDYKTLFSQDTTLEIDAGLIIPLEKVNKLLFGIIEDFPIIDKLTLLNSDIVIEKSKKYFLNLNKFEKYIELIRSQKERIPYFPYNYYNLFEPDSLDYKAIFEPIKEYLNFLDSVGNQHSETIKYIINPKNILNCSLLSTFNNTYCLKFDKKGKPLYITLYFEYEETDCGLSYSPDRDEVQYEKIFEKHKNVLLMENPERFLITNLQRITGDENFATNIVKSYLSKNDFNTKIIDICNLILWKNTDAMYNSIEKFMVNYSHLVKGEIEDIYTELEEIKTNFEGFNKFLLSLDEANLQQWEVKEQINELY